MTLCSDNKVLQPKLFLSHTIFIIKCLHVPEGFTISSSLKKRYQFLCSTQAWKKFLSRYFESQARHFPFIQQQQSQTSGSGTMISNTASTYVSSNIAIITDEVKQKQLLQEDEAEDFLDEG